MLQQNTIRDTADWVLIDRAQIVEESERALEFLDRRGGWAKGSGA